MKEIYFIIAFMSLKKIEGKNENLWREDSEGRAIYRNAYLNYESEYGWDLREVNDEFKAFNVNSSNVNTINVK